MLQQMKWWTFTLVCVSVLYACEHKPINEAGPDKPQPVDTATACDPNTVYFVNSILPMLNSNCAQAACHDAGYKASDVQLDNYDAIMGSGVIKPGKPFDGDLMEAITSTDPDKRMPPPPAAPLSQTQIDMLRTWIQQGAKNNFCNSACDTTVYSYSGAVSSILSNNCVACHSSGNVLLNTYTGVKSKVDDGRLWGAINHLSGFNPMPNVNTFLSDCDRKKIKKWIDSGAPNN